MKEFRTSSNAWHFVAIICGEVSVSAVEGGGVGLPRYVGLRLRNLARVMLAKKLYLRADVLHWPIFCRLWTDDGVSSRRMSRVRIYKP